MKPPFQLDDDFYQDLLKMLNNMHFTDLFGEQKDMDFIKDGVWLADTAVIENIWRRKGIWEIHLLFAHHKQPLKFLSRNITKQSCPKKAATMAGFMRRLAAKDQRGTLSLDIEDFKLPLN